MGIFTFMQEVAENPQRVILQKNVDGVWKNAQADEYGQWIIINQCFITDGSEYKECHLRYRKMENITESDVRFGCTF